ncbi:MAG: helix-turn-helix domain-containing protein [Actinobacteria bacterium]|nr:MAG: helix-turn-helix domain-containing protein [Actinomycetota bacterium]
MSIKNLTLHEVAEILDVHYMTAYRYVREGRLHAIKEGRGWVVKLSDLNAFRKGFGSAVVPKTGNRKVAPWSDRMLLLLISGDERGVVTLMESVLRSGNDLYFLYLDVLVPAMRAIGKKWESGEIDVFVEHRASGIASRSAARVGSRFSKRGVRKGTVLIGSPEGEWHVLGSQLLSDLIHLEGWKIDDLGPNVPVESFVAAATQIPDVVAVCIASTMKETLPAMRETIAKIKKTLNNSIPCFAGGAAVLDSEHAESLGADYWASDLRMLLPMLKQHAIRT